MCQNRYTQAQIAQIRCCERQVHINSKRRHDKKTVHTVCMQYLPFGACKKSMTAKISTDKFNLIEMSNGLAAEQRTTTNNNRNNRHQMTTEFFWFVCQCPSPDAFMQEISSDVFFFLFLFACLFVCLFQCYGLIQTDRVANANQPNAVQMSRLYWTATKNSELSIKW